MSLRANRRHHVFRSGALIGLRSAARSGWSVMSRGSDRSDRLSVGRTWSPAIVDNIYIYMNESGVIVAGDVNK